MKRLHERVALVTGSAAGMGRAIAEALLDEGARVAINDVNETLLKSTVDELKAEGFTAHGIEADVSSREEVFAMVEEIVKHFGRVDILVNNAGGALKTPHVLQEVGEIHWNTVVDVNLKGLFFCCARAIPHLKETQGCIVNIASDCGLVGTPDTSVYTAGKGGVVLLTKALAIELAPSLVRANAVCPADVMTPMLEGQARDFGGGDEEGYFRTLLTCYAQGDKARFIEPEEVAELIVYLSSRAAAPITGAAVPIDFGTTAGYGYG